MGGPYLITSVDIGTRFTKGASLIVEDGKYRLLAYTEQDSRGIEKGDVKDITSFKDNIISVVGDLESQYPKIWKGDFVFSFSTDRFSLDSSSYRKELSEDEDSSVEVSEEMLEEIKESVVDEISNEEAGYRVFHYYPKRFVINDIRTVFNPVGMPAHSLTVEYTAVKVDFSMQDMIRSIIEDAIQTDFTFFASPITSAEGILTATEKDSGVIVLDMGHEFTTCVAYLNGIPIDLRIVPIGVRHVIKDVAYVLATSIKEAERLLKIYGSATYDLYREEDEEIEYKALDGRTIKRTRLKDLSMIINARVTEILNKSRRIYKDLERKIPEYRENGIPGGVVLTGGGAKIRNIIDTATTSFKTNVRIGAFLKSLPEDIEVEGEESVLDDPAFSAVFGNVVELEKLYREEGAVVGGKKRSSGFIKALLKFFRDLF